MEIEFTGKRKDNQEWVTGSLQIEYDGTCHISYWVNELTDPSVNLWEPINKYHEVIPESVGQYTGLKDKNGDKIYGGHILKTPAAMLRDTFNYTYVEYNSEIASYIKRTKDNKGYTRLEIRIKEVEIIGNMTDNPELLQSL